MVGGLQVLMPSNNKLVFIGTGGNMHRYITANEKNIKVVSRCKAITAEGKEMTRVLKAAGIENVYYVPNFKKISYIPSKPKRSGEKIKFLFFARITPFKGCNLIIDAIDRLKEEGYGERVEVHFYGMMLEEYRKEFEEKIERNKDVATYHGVLNPNGKEIYDELARYDVMLFPTYWSDEGFPGSLVDAFIAGLPVIASDWNQNGEIISNGENGFLVPPRDSVALAEKMKLMIDNPSEYIDNRVKTIQQEALKYDVMHIFSADFMQKLGLCSE
jgi:glycosyltransferase involved in cell wall biosynthesis